MPILQAEPTVFPENLFDDLSAEPSGRSWWAVYTKARQEKSLARDLYRHEIPFYLPLVANDLVIREKHVQSFLPLFHGYLFLFGTDEERIGTLKTNRISRIMPVWDQEELHNDLKQLRSLIELGAPLTIEERLGVGDRVRVKTGRMKGIEGTVITRRRRRRLIVAVTFLQQGVSMEVDDFALEQIG